LKVFRTNTKKHELSTLSYIILYNSNVFNFITVPKKENSAGRRPKHIIRKPYMYNLDVPIKRHTNYHEKSFSYHVDLIINDFTI